MIDVVLRMITELIKISRMAGFSSRMLSVYPIKFLHLILSGIGEF